MILNFGSAKLYCQAVAISNSIKDNDKGMSTIERVRSRTRRLVRTATASDTYAAIQLARVRLSFCFASTIADIQQADPAESLNAMLRSLRLWNRAIDALSRLTHKPSGPQDDNPFDTRDSQPAQPSPAFVPEQPALHGSLSQTSVVDGSEWAVSEGLLLVMFSISQMYLIRGSARESQYFAQQAEEFATTLNAAAMMTKALSNQGELHLHLRQFDQAKASISRATALIESLPGVEAADVRRLDGDYNRLLAQHEEAHKLYSEATSTLDVLASSFHTIDALLPR
jgi:separase